MSTAHVCLRSVLTQAFRPSNFGVAASHSVASFLVPAVSRPPKRSFSATQRARKVHSAASQTNTDGANYAQLLKPPPKPTSDRPRSRISFPPHDVRGDVNEWIAVLDPFLPSPLRKKIPSQSEELLAVTSTDLSLFLIAAQAAKLDILSHLGLVEGRWAAVVWLAKKLAEDGRRSIEPPVQLEPFNNPPWSGTDTASLHELTNSPVRFAQSRSTGKTELSLNDLTSAADSLNHHHAITKRALGQLWRSLGSIILQSTERTDDQDDVMPHVLEIIAHLHHVGLIPDAVYTYRPNEYQYALQQPPTLHLLSSQILTTLSDATWKAHEASVRLAKKDEKVSYFLGHEIPGSRYRTVVFGVARELWLELVLWSSLHGGWIQDGMAVLQQLAQRQGTQSWGLISWREIMQAEQQNTPAPSRRWKLFPMKGDLAPSAQDRARTRRTISSEVVTAFIDAIIGEMRVAVGFRGIEPELLVEQIKTLKGFLDVNNLSLGSTSWDSIMARLIESGGIEPTKQPQILLRLFELAAEFGVEVSSANASAAVSTDVPYFFEPTALPLNLLHQAIRLFHRNGDLSGAMTAFKLLQQYTDENKQRSLQEFFKLLKATTPHKDGPFTSGLPPVHYPAFEINLPIPLRAKLLDLATTSKELDLGRWFLFAQDLDGPLIPRGMYTHRSVAASIVRFGTMSGENDLVMEVVEKAGVWQEDLQQQRMPDEVLVTLLCSQIQLHRWDSVQSMQQYVVDTATLRPPSIIFATFAAELMRLTKESSDQLSQAQDAFTDLLFGWERILQSHVQNDLYCLLAIMSTVHKEWARYCSRFLAISFRQEVNLSASDFNTVLAGVLDAYGSTAGKRIIETWCPKAEHYFESERAPGGLIKMSRHWVGGAGAYKRRPKDIKLAQESGATQNFQGRIRPNRQTIQFVLRRVRLELDQDPSETEHGRLSDVVKWSVRMLSMMGFDHGDIGHDLGDRLMRLAKLEAPVFDDGVGDDRRH